MKKDISKEGDIKKDKLETIEENLTSNNPDIFDGVPEEKKLEILNNFLSYTKIERRSHSGPLPDPETLQRYDDIINDGADRIMKLTEKQLSHRINIETILVKNQSRQSILGQIFGFVIGVIGIVSGVILAFNGHTTVGSIIGGGTVVSLVTVFVLGKKSQNQNNTD